MPPIGWAPLRAVEQMEIAACAESFQPEESGTGMSQPEIESVVCNQLAVWCLLRIYCSERSWRLLYHKLFRNIALDCNC